MHKKIWKDTSFPQTDTSGYPQGGEWNEEG